MLATVATGCGSSPRGVANLSGALTAQLDLVQVSVQGIPSSWTFQATSSQFAEPLFKFVIAGFETSLPTAALSDTNAANFSGSVVVGGDIGGAGSGGQDTWRLYGGTNPPEAVVGTFELTITSSGDSAQSVAGGLVYANAHGNGTASLIPDATNGPSAVGNLSLKMSF